MNYQRTQNAVGNSKKIIQISAWRDFELRLVSRVFQWKISFTVSRPPMRRPMASP
jgi:hypothetical protein